MTRPPDLVAPERGMQEWSEADMVEGCAIGSTQSLLMRGSDMVRAMPAGGAWALTVARAGHWTFRQPTSERQMRIRVGWGWLWTWQ